MRKLKHQVHIATNGFTEEPNGKMEWAVINWNKELKNNVGRIKEHVECIILGRKFVLEINSNLASDPEEEDADNFKSTKQVFLKNA